MSFVTDELTRLAAKEGFNWSTASGLTAILLGISSNALSRANQQTLISGYAVLGRYGGSSDQTVTINSVDVNTTAHRTEGYAANLSWATLAFNTENVGGILIYRNTGAADGPPLLVIDDNPPFPFAPTGVTFNVYPNVAGLFQYSSS